MRTRLICREDCAALAGPASQPAKDDRKAQVQTYSQQFVEAIFDEKALRNLGIRVFDISERENSMRCEAESLQLQVKALERRVRYLTVACVALLASTLLPQHQNVRADSSPQSLTVKRLAVVDENGIERVVIAAPVPDPIVHGQRLKRAGAASGILIYDPKGNERGGYLTNDTNSAGAFLTLDSEDGQVFTAYANASGKNGATVSLESDKHDSITLTTYERPRMQMKQNGKIVEKIPVKAPDVR